MIFQEKLFTKEECQRIIDYSNVYTDIKGWYPPDVIVGNKIVGKNNHYVYEGYIILNDKDTKWFFDKILNWFSQKSNIKLDNKVTNCGLHKYYTGDFFKRHIDLYTGFKERRYNLGIQLTEDYGGGEYICWDKHENEIQISKEVGTALAYHCRVPHEIKEITHGERWSIVMPICDYNIIESKSLI